MKEVLVASVRIPPAKIRERGVFSVNIERRWYVIRAGELTVHVYRLEGMSDLDTAVVKRLELQSEAPF